jgi:hypothetical protein
LGANYEPKHKGIWVFDTFFISLYVWQGFFKNRIGVFEISYLSKNEVLRYLNGVFPFLSTIVFGPN